ncbi:BTAD domain-containing putative transcriptional regulator [Kitasatospora sp. NPDC053057]|uniref:AfsR/SARP family transcriptional regulator n=1 Tax=Kitasatospora sp. NPDC053057 TaxID=3364062 RepID=UPI0037C7D6D5
MGTPQQGLRFGILGPVVLWHDDREVDLATRPSRTLLARLLLALDRAVHVDILIDAVYGSKPPRSARNQIQKSACELRAKGVELTARDGSYLLSSTPEALDAEKFGELVDQARSLSDPQERANALRHADSLWRGPTLDRLDASVFRSAAAEWDEKRLVAVIERIEAEMLCHQHRQVIPELRRLIIEHPLNENLHTLFMIACYHAGRISEAARCYSALRVQLAEEFGIDPPAALQEVHRMILRQDPDLIRITTLHQVEALAEGALTHAS